MSLSLNPQIDAQAEDHAVAARTALGSVDVGARAKVVNRTHRVVRQRAVVMKERRSYVRSLMVPLAICSVLLALAGTAIWTGLYQYEAAEAIQDVASLATTEANNHLLLALLWFMPLVVILLVAVWVRSVRSRESETR